jgi:hypothetical protein
MSSARSMAQAADTTAKVTAFVAMLASKVLRKLCNGTRRPREADRVLKWPVSKHSYRGPSQQRGPTRRVPAKIITLHQTIVQQAKQRHWVIMGRCQGRGDDPVCQQRLGQNPGQRGEQRPVRPSDLWLGVAAA